MFGGLDSIANVSKVYLDLNHHSIMGILCGQPVCQIGEKKYIYIYKYTP